jgi:hypothetical protein
MQQVTINFEAGPVEVYKTCREYVGALVHQQGRPQKAIAADMDYSPSDLSRKLAQSPDDSRRFTLDDLEKFIDTTSDVRPVLYLVEKYLHRADQQRIADLERELNRLKSKGARK